MIRRSDSLSEAPQVKPWKRRVGYYVVISGALAMLSKLIMATGGSLVEWMTLLAYVAWGGYWIAGNPKRAG